MFQIFGNLDITEWQILTNTSTNQEYTNYSTTETDLALLKYIYICSKNESNEACSVFIQYHAAPVP